MKTIKPSSGQEGTVFQDATDECISPAGGLPACPDLERWLSECKDGWLKADVLELLDGPLDVAWARVLAAARLERFGFDESDDVAAPSRVWQWAARWTEQEVKAVRQEIGVRAGLLHDDLKEAEGAALAGDTTWQVRMASVLRRRDDLAAVCVLLGATARTVRAPASLIRLDESGNDVMAALPLWELDEEWLWRIAVGLPDVWWVQALPGMVELSPPPPPPLPRHAPDFRQPWYDGRSLPFED